MTFSPEWPEAPRFIKKIVQKGVVASIGHTRASASEIASAVSAGATLSTHLGNGADATLPKSSNYIWDQLADDRLAASFIVDGFHLPPSFLSVALRAKGETADEIAGCAEAMREHVLRVNPKRDDLVDIVGTGGDGANTYNISTAAALAAAGAGAAIAKHGNRAASSASGAADVLEALGFRLELPPERIERSIDELGFGFLFAQAHHPAMRHAGPVRKELAARTIFNVLGPLTNPAGARAQVVGVYSPLLVPVIADVLAKLGARRAFVVHGAGGIDELSPAGPNLVCEVVDGDVRKREIDPLDLV